MASRLLFTRTAERDRDRILDYLAHDLSSLQAAGHFLDELEASLMRICEYPELYALSKYTYLAYLGYRPCPVLNYLLLYQYDREADETVVGRIFHGSQDFAKLI